MNEEDNGSSIGHVERERKIPNYQVGKYLKIKNNVDGLPLGLQKSLLVVGTLPWVRWPWVCGLPLPLKSHTGLCKIVGKMLSAYKCWLQNPTSGNFIKANHQQDSEYMNRQISVALFVAAKSGVKCSKIRQKSWHNLVEYYAASKMVLGHVYWHGEMSAVRRKRQASYPYNKISAISFILPSAILSKCCLPDRCSLTLPPKSL